MTRNLVGLCALAVLLLTAPAFGAAPVPVPTPTPEALAYHHGQDLFWLADQALGFLMPAIILFTGWSAGLMRWSRSLTRGRCYPTLALYSMAYIVIAFIVELPLSYEHDYVFAHAYDQSSQTMAKWTH